MSIKHAILGLLYSKDMHGYRIKKSLEGDFGRMWTLNYGQIYQTLARMREEALVSMVEEPRKDSPDRKLYSITAAGRAEFDRWLAAPVDKKPVLRDPFLIRFAFLSLGDRERALALIDEQIADYEKQREARVGERPRRTRGNIYGRLLADLGISSNEAMLAWLRRARVEIASQKRPGDQS